MNNRYVVKYIPDAYESADLRATEAEYTDYDHGYYLLDCSTDPPEIIFDDLMEPEDAILPRDLSPLVDELNRLARTNTDLEARLAEAERELVVLRADDPTDCPEENCIQATGHHRAKQLTAAGRHYDAHVMESLSGYLEQTLDESHANYRNWQAAERRARIAERALGAMSRQTGRLCPGEEITGLIDGCLYPDSDFDDPGCDTCLAAWAYAIAESEESDD